MIALAILLTGAGSYAMRRSSFLPWRAMHSPRYCCGRWNTLLPP